MIKPLQGLKIGVFDIEIVGAGFGANKSTLFTFGGKTVGDKKLTLMSLPFQFRSSWEKDRLNDRPIVEAVHKFFQEHDVVVAHYGSKFDMTYLRAKMLEHKLPPLHEPYLIDTCLLSRFRLQLSSNSLDALIDYLDIPHKKTHFSVKLWRRAEHGDVKAAKYIHDHCRIDVIALEQVFLRMQDIIWEMPVAHVVIDGNQPCPICKGKLESKGPRRTKTRVYTRYRCKKCGQNYHDKGKRWAY